MQANVSTICVLVGLGQSLSLAQPSGLAVVSIENTSEEAQRANLGNGLTSMLTSELSKYPELNLIERLEFERLLMEHDLSVSDLFDARTSPRLGKLLGVRFVLVGSVAKSGSSLEIDIRLVDAHDGCAVAAWSASSAEHDLSTTVGNLAKDISKWRALRRSSAGDRVVVATFEDGQNGKNGGATCAEMMVTTILKAGRFRVIERKHLKRIVGEMDLGSAGILDSQQAVQTGKLLGAKLIICGNVTTLDQRRILDARLIDVESGRIARGSTREIRSGEGFRTGVQSLAAEIAQIAPPQLLSKKGMLKANYGGHDTFEDAVQWTDAAGEDHSFRVAIRLKSTNSTGDGEGEYGYYEGEAVFDGRVIDSWRKGPGEGNSYSPPNYQRELELDVVSYRINIIGGVWAEAFYEVTLSRKDL